MKQGIHPAYGPVNVTCSCGNLFEMNSTVGTKDYAVEVCSSCHPFYTGSQKNVENKGRVAMFNKRFNINKK